MMRAALPERSGDFSRAAGSWLARGFFGVLTGMPVLLVANAMPPCSARAAHPVVAHSHGLDLLHTMSLR